MNRIAPRINRLLFATVGNAAGCTLTDPAHHALPLNTIDPPAMDGDAWSMRPQRRSVRGLPSWTPVGSVVSLRAGGWCGADSGC